MQWLSRTIAILVFMVGPGLIGRAIDKWLRTSFFTPTGFCLGVVLATTALLVLARRLTPPAHGTPIPFDDEDDDPHHGQS